MFWRRKNKKDNVSYSEIKVEIPINLPVETYIKGMNVIEEEHGLRVQIGDVVTYQITNDHTSRIGVIIGSYFSLGWRETNVIGWHLIISQTEEDSNGMALTTGKIDKISLGDIVSLSIQEKRIKEATKEDILRDLRVYCTSCIYNCYDECPLKKYKI